MAGRACSVLLALVLLTGCVSARIGTGHGSAAPPPAALPPTTPPPTTAPTSTPSPTASMSESASTTAVPAGITPCPQADPSAAVGCLHQVLSDFWSGQLNNVIGESVVLDADPTQVPRPCRPGIELGTAITCRVDLTLYVSRQFLALIEANFHGVDLDLALASVTSHEIGHVLQYTLHQPQIQQHEESDATSRFVEQQADCLSGVWAAQAVRTGTLDGGRFLADAGKLIELVSSNPEIATHGTPRQRRAAIERGLTSGSPGVCRLVTFH
ncbi:MAG TPA: neutral zinc metallopeptidase [Jatrophihabitans sp.]|jgi:hypothetical protein